MKIGILTFHSQLNYGGVLQCWALQQALTKLGYEVVVIDRWWNAGNYRLLGDYHRLTPRAKLGYLRRALLARNGEFGAFVRRMRTIDFIKRNLNLTSYGFYDWKDAPDDLGVDIVLVGSDQVWRIGPSDDPTPYLLDFRNDFRKVAYAVSFGMTVIPETKIDDYRRSIGKFESVSCREREGCEICRGLGVAADYVVDPTLLLGAENYIRGKLSVRNCLVCYFLATDVQSVIWRLNEFAEAEGCDVTILVREDRRIPQWSLGRVRMVMSAGPKEFLRCISSARWVLTDSFHGLMFSAVFTRNVRVLRPSDDIRKGMFARIEEFVNSFMDGAGLSDTVDSALASFSADEKVSYDYAALRERIEYSRDWLRKHLK